MSASDPLTSVLATPLSRADVLMDSAFLTRHRANLDWLLDRLSKSTAGVRGLIADSPKLHELSLEQAARSTQLSPVVVATIAQAYAAYLRQQGEGAAAFVGFDARFLSRDFGIIFTRIFAGNGVRVVRDWRGESTPTPVTSFLSALLGLNGGIQITASHNPANYNGVKSSTAYGGVDTDDVSDRIAEEIHTLLRGGVLRFGSVDDPLVEAVDAKGLYLKHYLQAVFPGRDLAPLQAAIERGDGFLFDGLHGVGGQAMARYLDALLPGVNWRRSVHLLNAVPNPSIGGIEKPDPSDPDTLVHSGAIAHLTAHPEVLVSVTADMDADRIGTAVLIPPEKLESARKYGLFVTEFPGGVNAVRFTPNQVFTLIAYDRLVTLTGKSGSALRAERALSQEGPSCHLITTIASSVLAEQLARTFRLQFHQTAVGFKNLGKLAYEIDQRRTGDVVLALREESGGAQIGPFEPWSERGDTIHRDKDTCALALALFNLAARLKADGRSVLEFYLEMAEQFGSLAYFERLDAYLPDKPTAEDPKRADQAGAVKAEVLDRLISLADPSNARTLLGLLGFDPATAVEEAPHELTEISLLVKDGGVWKTVHPLARRFRVPGGGRLEYYRAGPMPHDGLRLTVYHPDGEISHWCLVRASGTEAMLRVYMEIVEPYSGPQPERLISHFEPLLRHLGLADYRLEPGDPDYIAAYAAAVRSKYSGPGSG